MICWVFSPHLPQSDLEEWEPHEAFHHYQEASLLPTEWDEVGAVAVEQVRVGVRIGLVLYTDESVYREWGSCFWVSTLGLQVDN